MKANNLRMPSFVACLACSGFGREDGRSDGTSGDRSHKILDISKSVVKMPKGNIRDSGLSNYIQGITKRDQLLNYPNVGAAFEAFILEEIIKGIQATEIVNWDYYYFRTRNGAEIDMIVEGTFGTLPIEIKFGSMIKQRQIQTLKNFVYKNDLPFGIVVNNSDDVQMVADRILQLPATCI